MRFSVGVTTHPDQITPHAGSAYYVFIGRRKKDKTVDWAKSWKDIQELTYQAPRPPGVKTPKPPTQSRGEYAYALRAALIHAVEAGRPDARKAFDWINGELNGRAGLQWRFAPPAMRTD
jgi:hypothetical protein